MANFNMSQFKSKMRSIENQYKREVRKIERQFNNDLNKYKRTVRQNQAKINSELNKLQNITKTKSSYTIWVTNVNQSYERLNQKYDFEETNNYNGLLQRIEEENVNNLEVANVLINNDEPDNDEYSLEDTILSNKLSNISIDLESRWKGALFSLNPKNPDATRHFCTSTREIFIQIIDNSAKDSEVTAVFPNCEKTERGSVSRRSKIKFLLYRKGLTDTEIEEFVHSDIENILALLYELNSGTHGNAGKYSINQLKSIKKRAEGCLNFLCEYVA